VTVSELIEALDDLPQNAKVVLQARGEDSEATHDLGNGDLYEGRAPSSSGSASRTGR
jgi:hypothetical protein